VAQPSTTYEPGDPTTSVLYGIVRDHFETFRTQAASLRDGDGLPRFVEQEFRDFLRCAAVWPAASPAFGALAAGWIDWSPSHAKAPGFCPRCGGWRMAERAVHLVDHVLPDVPVRQWVLSLPHRLRYLLAWDHDLCRAVSGVAMRAVLGFLRRRARRDGVADGRSGGGRVGRRAGSTRGASGGARPPVRRRTGRNRADHAGALSRARRLVRSARRTRGAGLPTRSVGAGGRYAPPPPFDATDDQLQDAAEFDAAW
jgi:hypothetical protein